ncbi:MAG: nitroreductase family protein [bacterium]
MLRDLVLKNRSYRRFRPDVALSANQLRGLVDLARLSASSANKQPLKYLLSWTPDRNGVIFPHLKWAGYLEDWPGPAETERPAAYIVVLGDNTISKSFGYDCGIAAQSILLGAVAEGFGGCMLGSVKREQLRAALSIPEALEILLVIALGAPAETVDIEEIGRDGSIKYWRDTDDVHHVPKRSLAEIVLD